MHLAINTLILNCQSSRSSFYSEETEVIATLVCFYRCLAQAGVWETWWCTCTRTLPAVLTVISGQLLTQHTLLPAVTDPILIKSPHKDCSHETQWESRVLLDEGSGCIRQPWVNNLGSISRHPDMVKNHWKPNLLYQRVLVVCVVSMGYVGLDASLYSFLYLIDQHWWCCWSMLGHAAFKGRLMPRRIASNKAHQTVELGLMTVIPHTQEPEARGPHGQSLPGPPNQALLCSPPAWRIKRSPRA